MQAPPKVHYNYIIPTTTEQVFDFFPSPPPVEASHGPFKMDVIKAVVLIKLNLTADLAWRGASRTRRDDAVVHPCKQASRNDLACCYPDRTR